MYPILALAFLLFLEILNPLIKILPLVGSIKPVSIFIVVDLPAPLGPKRPIISPSFISKEILSTATKLPYFLQTFLTVITKKTSLKYKINTYENTITRKKKIQ